MDYKSSAILLGFSLGDSLGLSFEFCKPTDPRLMSWDGKTFHGSDYHKLNPGDITDDTWMSLALANSIINAGTYKPEFAAEYYLRGYSANPVGYGKTTKQSMENLRKGARWHNSGIHLEEGNSGNGPAIRIVPLVIYHAFQNKTKYTYKNLEQDVYLDSIIIHKHPTDLTFQAALMYAKVLFDVIKTKGFSYGLISNPFIHYYINSTSKELKDKSENFKNFYDRKFFSDIEKDAAIFKQLIEFNDFGIVSTVCSAIFCADQYKDNFPKALEMAIRSGGDTDTKAALTGALVAARVGLKGIPKNYILNLNQFYEIIVTETLLIDTAFKIK